MRTVGIIGGMSWASTLEYYRLINEHVEKSSGYTKSAHILIDSLDFSMIDRLQHLKEWGKLSSIMVESALRLKQMGADFILIATNTMHRFASEIELKANIPVLHIVEVTAQEIERQGLRTVATLGTRFTVETGLYQNILLKHHGIHSIELVEHEIDSVHRIIYEELIYNQRLLDSEELLKKMVLSLKMRGAQGIVLGCTELPLLLKQKGCSIPLLDTLTLHAIEAANHCLKD